MNRPMKRAARRALGAALAACILGQLFCARRPGLVHVKRTFFRMDMPVELTVVSAGNRDLAPVWAAADSLLAHWEQRYSQNAAGSELLALNSRSANRAAVSPVLSRMLAAAQRYGDTTNGYFDFTVLPLKEAWGLGETDTAPSSPSPDRLARLLGVVGRGKVAVDTAADSIRFSGEEVRIDAGGVAKGFALVELRERLRGLGFTAFLISGGGDIVSAGLRADGTAWRVGIQHPRSPDKLLAVVTLDSGSIFTSGDYQRFRMENGRRIHHIFNPYTGYSCTRNQSLTVWGMDPIELKMLSTGLFCQPADSIMAFVGRRPRLECVVVDSGGTVFVSDGWRDRVALRE